MKIQVGPCRHAVPLHLTGVDKLPKGLTYPLLFQQLKADYCEEVWIVHLQSMIEKQHYFNTGKVASGSCQSNLILES